MLSKKISRPRWGGFGLLEFLGGFGDGLIMAFAGPACHNLGRGFDGAFAPGVSEMKLNDLGGLVDGECAKSDMERFDALQRETGVVGMPGLKNRQAVVVQDTSQLHTENARPDGEVINAPRAVKISVKFGQTLGPIFLAEDVGGGEGVIAVELSDGGFGNKTWKAGAHMVGDNLRAFHLAAVEQAVKTDSG